MNEHEKNLSTDTVAIDFLYLDLETCTRCKDTDDNLGAALSEVSQLLTSAGITTQVKKNQITNQQQASELNFISSPTLRVNGRDIAMQFKQSRCESCESCACNGEIECRVWVYQGKEYLQAPKAMIINAILSAVYDKSGSKNTPIDDAEIASQQANLQRFFDGVQNQKSQAATSCCDSTQRETCCETDDRQSCCSTTDTNTPVASNNCGC